jgi:hypothetical protein
MIWPCGVSIHPVRTSRPSVWPASSQRRTVTLEVFCSMSAQGHPFYAAARDFSATGGISVVTTLLGYYDSQLSSHSGE